MRLTPTRQEKSDKKKAESMTRREILIMLLILGYEVPMRAAAESLLRDERGTKRWILQHYRPEIAPPYTKELEIHFGYSLLKIIHLDEKSERLKIALYVTIEWTDERLVWGDEYMPPGAMMAHKQTGVWVPSIVLYNSVHGQQNVLDDKVLVAVEGKGWATMTGVVTLTSPCEMDVTNFPMDEQVCEHVFHLVTRDDFLTLSGALLQEAPVPVTKDSAWNIDKKKDITILPRGNTSQQIVKFRLKFSRKYQYYLGRVLAPLLVISVLVILVFFIPPDAGEKIALGVTLLLAFSVFTLAMDADLPKTSDSTPIITIAMIMLQVCSAMSIFASILVLNIHHCTTGRMPNSFRKILKMLSFATFHRSSVLRLQNVQSDVDSKEKTPDSITTDVARRVKDDTETESPENAGKTAVKVESILKQIVQQLKEENHEENEWKLAALILDRVLMYACVITMIGVYANFFIRLSL